MKRALDYSLDVPLKPRTYAYGKAFEHFIVLEVIRLNDYFRKHYRLSYLKTKDRAEVDLVIDRPRKTKIFVEIKSGNVATEEVSRLERIAHSFPDSKTLIICQEENRRKVDTTLILPWKEGLKEIFA